MRERLARIPGVRAVTYSQNGLFSGSESGDKISVEGYKSQKPQDLHARFDAGRPELLLRRWASPSCWGAISGRRMWSRRNRSAWSTRLSPNSISATQNPIGKHVTDEFPDTRKTFTIVGVARDARDHSLRREIFRRFYLSALQPLGGFSPDMNYEIRTFGEPGAVIQAARKAILAYDPAIPIGRVQPFVAMLDDNMRQERIIAQLSTVFGGLALLLAAIGLYGVLSYAVAQRTNEIGIRMALGAERGAVVRMILRETALLIVIGLAVGVPASLACARLVQSKLFGLKPADPADPGGGSGHHDRGGRRLRLSAGAPRIARGSAHRAALRINNKSIFQNHRLMITFCSV